MLCTFLIWNCMKKKVKYLNEATEEMCCYQETQYTDTYDVSIIKIQLQFRTVHR